MMYTLPVVTGPIVTRPCSPRRSPTIPWCPSPTVGLRFRQGCDMAYDKLGFGTIRGTVSSPNPDFSSAKALALKTMREVIGR